MVDKLTPVQQQTEMGEGLAVGCLVVGVSAMTSQDGPLESAFAQALASWPWVARYRSLTRSQKWPARSIIRKSAGRRRSHVAR